MPPTHTKRGGRVIEWWTHDTFAGYRRKEQLMHLSDAPPCRCGDQADKHQKLWLDVDEFRLGMCQRGECRCSNYDPAT